MRLSRTSIQKAVAGVAVGTGMVAVTNANAAVVYDLRLASGAHSVNAVAGQSYTVDLWAIVSGTNGTNTDDGIQSSYAKILSTQLGSGGGIATGGITAAAVSTDFQSFSGTAPLHRNGGGADLNGDGIVDWGSNSTSSADTNYLFARNAGIVNGGTTIGSAVDVNTWQFKLASFTVTATTLGSGTTTFNLVKPNATAVTAVTYAVARVDNTAFNVSSTNQQGAYPSGGVSFVGGAPIPEPTTLGLAGIAAIGLIGRRRK